MKKLLLRALPAVLTVLALPLFAQDFNLELRSTLVYPNQTLANVCGYTANGREYALAGGSKGLIIVDITNPDLPVQIVQIPGPDNLWKEIKTYSHYAYVTSEGGGGVQIVDLSNLPGSNLTYHNYTGTGEIAGQLGAIHALHIDVKKGFLYTFGGDFQSARVHALSPDPYNPTYVGKFDQLGYIHDGYADNDTLYACHIYTGLLSITDMSDKQSPQLLGTVQTPGKFTHNSWLLDDHKHILTTDEEFPSFVTSYDISNPGDIKELDRFSPNDGFASIGHNTHVLNDWAVTSWYVDGFTIVDAHRPQNLVMVGRYDTWTGGNGKFDGCWGVYPFFPSGNIIASNIPNTNGGTGTLFVLTPTYVRACYLEGKILDGCTGLPLNGAEIKINSSDPGTTTNSKADGSFATGQASPGNFTVAVSKPGFSPQIVNVTLKPGEVTPLNVTLQASSATYNINATVTNGFNNKPVDNATIYLLNGTSEYKVKTDAAGKFDLDCVPSGKYRVGTWGFLIGEAIVSANGPLSITLQPGYYDDFELDLGWKETHTSEFGVWVRAEPIGTYAQNGDLVNPDTDADADNNDLCYVTGNGGGGPGSDDIDDGNVILITPPLKLAAYSDAVLNFYYWFYNAAINANPPNDSYEVLVSNGQKTVSVFKQTVSQSVWRNSGDIHLKDFINLTDDIVIQFVADDIAPGHRLEGGLDIFKVTPVPVLGTHTIDQSALLSLRNNPTTSDFQLRYDWPTAKQVTLEVQNMLGQTVHSMTLGANSGTVRFGENLTAGMYLVSLRTEGRASVAVKAVKQ